MRYGHENHISNHLVGKRILCAVLLAAAVLLLCTSCSGKKAEEEEQVTAVLPAQKVSAYREKYELDGFDTPESAVLYFLDGLKNLDFEQMLDAYAWETLANHFSMDDYFRYLRTILESGEPWFPGPDPFIRRLNLETIRAKEAAAIAHMIENILLHRENEEEWEPVPLRDEGAVEEYLKKYDPARMEALKGISGIRFLDASDVAPKAFSTERQLELLAREKGFFGADEAMYLPTVADAGEGKLLLVPIVARYGNKWYMVSLDSRISNRIRQDNSSRTSGLFYFDELPFDDQTARKADTETPKPLVRGAVRYEGDGFASPEDAVTAYLESLKNLDIGRMLRAFAWETMMDRYDPEAWFRYIRVANVDRDVHIPVMNSLAARANMHYLRYCQIAGIYLSFERYLLPDYLPPPNNRMTVGRLKEEEVEALIQRFNDVPLEPFGSLANIRFIPPDEATGGKFSEEAFQQHFTAWAAIFGADEIRLLIALADMGDKQIMVTPTAVRYGHKWYLADLRSQYAPSLIDNYSYTNTMYGSGFTYGEDIPLTVSR